MKIKLNKKFLSLLFVGAITSITSCSDVVYEKDDVSSSKTPVYDLESNEECRSNVTEEVVSEFIEPVRINDNMPFVDIDSLEYNTRLQCIVVASSDTVIINENNERIGNFITGRNYDYIGEDENNYIIDYFGIVGYVSKESTFLSTKRRIIRPAINKGCMKDVTTLYEDKDLINEIDTLDIREFVLIYGEVGDSYLVQSRDKVGYVSKKSITLMEKDAAVVDIGNQEMRIYSGTDLKVSTPVVTGTIDTYRKSDEGLFTIRVKYHPVKEFDISPGYKVKGVLYYNGGEGIHTANNWRSEYGGDIALKNGSHGCINTPDDKFEELFEYMDIGEYVLVYTKRR